MSQQGWTHNPRYGQRDDWWSQLYDPGSPDTGSSRSGDTLDDRYASVRRTMNSGTGTPVRRRGAKPPAREPEDEWEWRAEDEQPTKVQRPLEEERPPGDERRARGEQPEPDPRTAAASEPSGRTAHAPHVPEATEPYETRRPEQYEQPEWREQYAQPAQPEQPEPSVGEFAESPEPAPGPAAYVGERPPTYAAEPATLPEADPSALSELVPDTVLDGAQYAGLTLRAVSLRGDSARHRGALRRDALLTARFGAGRSALLLVAVAAGGRSATGGHRAARELCHSVAAAVGRSHARLADDVRGGRRDALKPGLQRLTERCYGKLRAQAAALGLQPEEYTADLRCLLLSADPRCTTRIVFGTGAGGHFLLRGGLWYDLEADPDPRPDPDPVGARPQSEGKPYPSALDPSELGDLAALSVPMAGDTSEPDEDEPPGRPPAAPDTPAPGGPGGPRVPPAPSVPDAPSVPKPSVPEPSVPSAPSVPEPLVPEPSVAPTPSVPEPSEPPEESVQGPSGPPGPQVPPVPPVPGPSPASFWFGAVTARPADVLVLSSPGFAEPLRAVPDFAHRLADVWSDRARRGEPPGLAAYLADAQLRVRGYAEDRTTVTVWEN